MTAALVGRVWKIRFPRNQKPIMLKLADWANEDHLNCWCYLGSLCDYTSMSSATAKRALKELEQDGVLMIEHNKGKEANKYWLDLDRAAAKHGEIKPRYEKRPPWKSQPPPAPSGAVGKDLSTGAQNEPPKFSTAARNEPPAAQNEPPAAQNEPPTIEESLSDPRIGKEGAGPVEKSTPGEGDGRAGSTDPAVALAATPVNAIWKERRDRLIAELGEDAWNAWLAQCIPFADEAGIYTLACPSVRIAEQILDRYAPAIAAILERDEVRCVMRSWVGAALDRQAAAEREAAELDARYAVGVDEDSGQSAEDLEAEDRGGDPDWPTHVDADADVYFDDNGAPDESD